MVSNVEGALLASQEYPSLAECWKWQKCLLSDFAILRN